MNLQRSIGRQNHQRKKKAPVSQERNRRRAAKSNYWLKVKSSNKSLIAGPFTGTYGLPSVMGLG
jgi:hypothetical protein